MNSKKRIDFHSREFSGIEITSLIMLSAEVQESIDNIGVALVALSNSPYLDDSKKELISKMDHEAQLARSKLDKIVGIISIEKYLINDS